MDPHTKDGAEHPAPRRRIATPDHHCRDDIEVHAEARAHGYAGVIARHVKESSKSRRGRRRGEHRRYASVSRDSRQSARRISGLTDSMEEPPRGVWRGQPDELRTDAARISGVSGMPRTPARARAPQNPLGISSAS